MAGDDDCVGNKCSDIEAGIMRRGGRLPEQLIVKSDSLARSVMFMPLETVSGLTMTTVRTYILTFANWRSLVNK